MLRKVCFSGGIQGTIYHYFVEGFSAFFVFIINLALENRKISRVARGTKSFPLENQAEPRREWYSR